MEQRLTVAELEQRVSSKGSHLKKRSKCQYSRRLENEVNRCYKQMFEQMFDQFESVFYQLVRVTLVKEQSMEQNKFITS